MSFIYKSFLFISFIRHLKTPGLKILLGGKTPNLLLFQELARIGGVRALKMSRLGPVYKGQRIQNFEKSDYTLMRKSLTLFGPKESYMIIGEGQDFHCQSDIYIGQKRYAANINQLRSIVLDLQDQAESLGKQIKRIIVKHVHPSLEIIGKTGVVLHPLTNADIDLKERLELIVGKPVEVQALTPSLIKYSR